MQFILIIRELSRRRIRVAVGLVLAAAFSLYIVHSNPVKVSWSATEQIFVDSDVSAIPNATRALDPLVPRAGIYADIMTTPSVMQLISKAMGVPADQITAIGAPDSTGQSPIHPATVPSRERYKLQFAIPSPTQPLVTITGTSTNGDKAIALANAAATGLTQYLDGLAGSENLAQTKRIDIRELGGPTAASTETGLRKTMIAPLFLFLSGAWCLAIIVGIRFVEAWRRSAQPRGKPAAGDQPAVRPTTPADQPGAASSQTSDGGSGATHRGWGSAATSPRRSLAASIRTRKDPHAPLRAHASPGTGPLVMDEERPDAGDDTELMAPEFEAQTAEDELGWDYAAVLDVTADPDGGADLTLQSSGGHEDADSPTSGPVEARVENDSGESSSATTQQGRKGRWPNAKREA